MDASEGVVGGVTVTLTESSKGWVRSSKSVGDGSFLFAPVIAGLYSVRVDRAGFATEQTDNLKIEVGQQASVPFARMRRRSRRRDRRERLSATSHIQRPDPVPANWWKRSRERDGFAIPATNQWRAGSNSSIGLPSGSSI